VYGKGLKGCGDVKAKIKQGYDYADEVRSSLLQRCFRDIPGVKLMTEIKCKHAIHDSMRGKELNRWYIYIDEGTSHEERKGNLVLALFDQHGRSWDILAIGTDGKLHLYTGIPSYVEGIKVDDKGRIVVES
jgi:hypothetical protein